MESKSLIKKRGSYKSKLTQFKAYLKVIKSCKSLTSLQIIELQIRLSKIEELYSDFDCIQTDIENSCDIPEDQYKEREDFESQYFGAIAAAKEALTGQDSAADFGSAAGSGCTDHRGKGGPITHKLPTIKLPTFSGQYHDWLVFYNTYLSLIHTDNSIPKISKFHYLRAALCDSAAEVIHSLEFTPDNYDVAWGLLCERFNNKRLLVNNHLQAIFSIQSISRESGEAFRTIVDIINKNLRSLKALGLPVDGWDVLIIHIVSEKLDSVTSREWEAHRNALNELPTLIDFTKFLKNKADLLDSMKRRRHSDVTHVRHRSFALNSSPPRPTKALTCPLCKNSHAIYQCMKFKSLPIENRIQKARALKLCINCLRSGHNTQNCRLGTCKICDKSHNTLLHLNQPLNTHQQSQLVTHETPSGSFTHTPATSDVALCAIQPDTHSHTLNQETHDNVVLSAAHNQCVVLLSTALIQISDHDGHKHTVRALLDNGSTSSFITNELCTKLNLPTISSTTSVLGLNHQSSHITKRCEVIISSLHNSYTEHISCFIVPHITQNIPTAQVNYTSLNIPQNITLADPSFHTPSRVDMLLGADLFWSIINQNTISLGRKQPTLCETRFGWIVSGPIHTFNTVHCNHFITHNIDNQLQDQLNQFFELETVTIHQPSTKEEQECELHFSKTTERDADGRFIVTIPLKESPLVLGNSYEQALSRFISLERRFKRDTAFKQEYTNFIKEYISSGHMTENTSPEKDKFTYIIPHFAIIRETSLTTRLRVVFDASAVTTSGISFNNIQRVGPIVQSDLISILIRFRQHKVVVTADVQAMYRMVTVTENQRMLQQILWRFEPHEQLKQYKLNTVTYGTASAPYLATRCLIQLGKECTDKAVSDAIIHDCYVDDLLTGANSTSELISICRGVISQLEYGQFHLRKWHSNNSQLLLDLVGESSSEEFLNLSEHEYSKTLGLLWACKEDNLLFSVKITEHEHTTKRIILSTMSQVFDPLGLINPCILQAKIILQKLWSLKIGWDETIPTEIQNAWHNFIKSLTNINTIRIPRHIICDCPTLMDLHIFSDASTRSYSACVYIRSITNDNAVTINLVTAKSRVAPIKPMTVPRLELCGALLAVRLGEKVKKSFRLNMHKCTYWCDSTIVLAWIKSNKQASLKQFVYNRIHEINTLSEPNMWRYVPTHSNPADIGSRGMDAKQLKCSELWWKGPVFLTYSEAIWPIQPNLTKEVDLPELKIQSHYVTEVQSVEFIHKFSDYSKLQRITAYILRFIHNCRNSNTKYANHLTLHELNLSFITLCRISQKETFTHEYKLLKQNKQLPSKHTLLKLAPFFHTDQLIRVGGRLSNSNYDFDTKHPILLHSSHNLTKLIFKYYHKVLMHAGPQLLLANMRHKVWPLHGRNLARKTVHDCVICCRFSGRIKQPIMGNLPVQRLHANYPFINTAVDYAGPVMILNKKGRGSRLIKAYLCIFICMAIKAVHIELVADLSSETFIAALNRFIARRGKPVNIFSDNGTCFVGASNELKRFLISNVDYLGSYASELSINFKFSPVYSPHFNGLVENCVGRVKHHLKRILAIASLTYEEMNTVLTQIEAILNSRPLTPLSSDPSDLSVLTPSHFLIGRTLTVLPSPQVLDVTKMNSMSRHMRVQQLKNHFWQRFYKEYISELQIRQKWRKDGGGLQLNEMVLVKDDRVPPNRWLLGRVTGVYPGPDGVTRVADVMTTSGTLRRAFNRLCPLPRHEETDVPAEPDMSLDSSPGRQHVEA